MAKSLRSKWKRRMRAVKRVRYGEKEHDRLVTMLEKAGELPQKDEDVDVKMEESVNTTLIEASSNIPAFKSVKRLRKERRSKVRGEGRRSRRDDADAAKEDDDDEYEDAEEEMESGDEVQIIKDKSADGDSMSVDKPVHIFSKRTMKDQFGNYPEWMNRRKMKTQQKKNKRITKRRAMSSMGKRVRK